MKKPNKYAALAAFNEKHGIRLTLAEYEARPQAVVDLSLYPRHREPGKAYSHVLLENPDHRAAVDTLLLASRHAERENRRHLATLRTQPPHPGRWGSWSGLDLMAEEATKGFVATIYQGVILQDQAGRRLGGVRWNAVLLDSCSDPALDALNADLDRDGQARDELLEELAEHEPAPLTFAVSAQTFYRLAEDGQTAVAGRTEPLDLESPNLDGLREQLQARFPFPDGCLWDVVLEAPDTRIQVSHGDQPPRVFWLNVRSMPGQLLKPVTPADVPDLPELGNPFHYGLVPPGEPFAPPEYAWAAEMDRAVEQLRNDGLLADHSAPDAQGQPRPVLRRAQDTPVWATVRGLTDAGRAEAERL